LGGSGVAILGRTERTSSSSSIGRHVLAEAAVLDCVPCGGAASSVVHSNVRTNIASIKLNSTPPDNSVGTVTVIDASDGSDAAGADGSDAADGADG
jgi:hypothetical protein